MTTPEKKLQYLRQHLAGDGLKVSCKFPSGAYERGEWIPDKPIDTIMFSLPVFLRDGQVYVMREQFHSHFDGSSYCFRVPSSGYPQEQRRVMLQQHAETTYFTLARGDESFVSDVIRADILYRRNVQRNRIRYTYYCAVCGCHHSSGLAQVAVFTGYGCAWQHYLADVMVCENCLPDYIADENRDDQTVVINGTPVEKPERVVVSTTRNYRLGTQGLFLETKVIYNYGDPDTTIETVDGIPADVPAKTVTALKERQHREHVAALKEGGAVEMTLVADRKNPQKGIGNYRGKVCFIDGGTPAQRVLVDITQNDPAKKFCVGRIVAKL